MLTRSAIFSFGVRVHRESRAGLRAPAPAARPDAERTRSTHPSERYYVGRRPSTTEVYVVTAGSVELLGHPGFRSDAGFDWGDLTAGALELSFALLACSTGRRPPEAICLTFQRDVIARLDRAGFVLSDGEIALWLLTAFGEHGRGRASLLRLLGLSRAADWLRSRSSHR